MGADIANVLATRFVPMPQSPLEALATSQRIAESKAQVAREQQLLPYQIQQTQAQTEQMQMENQLRQLDLQDQLFLRDYLNRRYQASQQPVLGATQPQAQPEAGFTDPNTGVFVQNPAALIAPKPAAQQPGFNPFDYLDDPELERRMLPKNYLALQTSVAGLKDKWATTAKALADADEAETRSHTAVTNLIGSSMLGVKNAGYNPTAFIAAMHHLGDLGPQFKPQVDAWLDQARQNPGMLQGIVDQAIAESNVATTARQAQEKQAPEILAAKGQQAQREFQALPRDATGAPSSTDYQNWRIENRGVPEVDRAPTSYDPAWEQRYTRALVPPEKQPEFDINTMKARMGLYGNNEFDQYLVQAARGMGKTPATLTPSQFFTAMQNYSRLKQDPQMYALAIAQKQTADALANMQLMQMPNQQDVNTVASKVVSGDIAPSQFAELRSGRMGIPGMKIMSAVEQMQPGFDWTMADARFKAMEKTEDAFTTGKEAQMVRANNNALEHLNLLDQARVALNNGNVQLANQFLNRLGAEFGETGPTTMDHIAQRVADEVSKAFLPGGGTAGERGQTSSGYGTKLGDRQIAANIRSDVQLMDSQQRNLADQYNRGTYGKGHQQLYTPEAMAARNQLLGVQAGAGTAGPAAGGQQGPPPPPPGTPARPASIPKGAKAQYNTQTKQWRYSTDNGATWQMVKGG